MKKQVSDGPGESSEGCRTRCWFDSTTLFRLRGFRPVGLTRVEASILFGAIRQQTESTHFCMYDRYKGEGRRVDEQHIRSLLEGYGIGGDAKPRQIFKAKEIDNG